MRSTVLSASVGLALACALVTAQTPDVPPALVAARQALGGDALSGVKSFTVNGSIAFELGRHSLYGSVRIDAQLPDRFLRRMDMSAGTASTSRIEGFNADELIYDLQGNASAMTVAAADDRPAIDRAVARQKRLVRIKAEFVRLSLVLFGDAPGLRLEFIPAGQATVNGISADVVSVKGEDDFAAQLFFDARTHLPLMVRYTDVQILPGGRVMTNAGTVDPDTGLRRGAQAVVIDPTENAPSVEHKMFLADYRAENGVTWPHRLTDYVDGRISNETKLKAFKVNEKIDPKKFQPKSAR